MPWWYNLYLVPTTYSTEHRNINSSEMKSTSKAAGYNSLRYNSVGFLFRNSNLKERTFPVSIFWLPIRLNQLCVFDPTNDSGIIDQNLMALSTLLHTWHPSVRIIGAEQLVITYICLNFVTVLHFTICHPFCARNGP